MKLLYGTGNPAKAAAMQNRIAGLGIMRPFLIANMVNLAIRLSVALICAPRFGIDFVWLAVPAGWLANFLVSYAALRKSWPGEKVEPF